MTRGTQQEEDGGWGGQRIPGSWNEKYMGVKRIISDV